MSTRACESSAARRSRTWPARWLSVVLLLTAPVGSLAGEEPAAGQMVGGAEITRVTLHGGHVLRGQIVAQDEKQVTLELMTGARMTLDMSTVEEIAVERGLMGPVTEKKFQRRASRDATRTRYLYGPSAMMLQGGEGYFSQKELLFSSLEVGLTNNISVRVESVLPLPLLYPGNGLNVFGTVKVGGSFSENLHLAGGVQLLVVQGSGINLAGIAFGAFTLGNPDLHGTLFAGYPFVPGSGPFPGFMFISASGQLRLSRAWGLVTENWFLPGVPGISSGTSLINALALRFAPSKYLVIDFGAVYLHGAMLPVPWLDFTFGWG